MTTNRLVASLAVAAGLALSTGVARAQSPRALDEAARAIELPDEKIDAIQFQDHDGMMGSGERARLFSELNPELYAQSRRLRRRLHFARPEDRAAITSEMIDLHTEIGNWTNREIRRAPIDALDAMLAVQSADFAEIERIDPGLCGPDIWGMETANYASRQALPSLTARQDIALYRAVAAARARPTIYPPLDEAMGAVFFKALEDAGVSEKGMLSIFSDQGPDKLTPTERCDFGRRMMNAIAGLPDKVRGAFLAYHYSGYDAGDR